MTDKYAGHTPASLKEFAKNFEKAFSDATRLIADAPKLLEENKRLIKVIKEMPALTLSFNCKDDMDAWNEWKSKYLDKEGNLKVLKESEHED